MAAASETQRINSGKGDKNDRNIAIHHNFDRCGFDAVAKRVYVLGRRTLL